MLSEGYSPGYHVTSASTPRRGEAFQARRPPTPRSTPSNSLQSEEAKCTPASNDCACTCGIVTNSKYRTATHDRRMILPTGAGFTSLPVVGPGLHHARAV